ncbi:hypothetical protein B0H13DRAFT_1893642 [Mycena leptocephala]|nr:hypothetical protein B0H13DRAFT_1893642 [Mycena leptocephala]
MFPQPTFVVSPSLTGVRKVAADVNVYSDPIHVLIHDAAAAIGSPSTRLSTRPNPETYNSAGAFFEVKAANVLTAVELSTRSKGALNAYSLHRGGGVDPSPEAFLARRNSSGKPFRRVPRRAPNSSLAEVVLFIHFFLLYWRRRIRSSPVFLGLLIPFSCRQTPLLNNSITKTRLLQMRMLSLLPANAAELWTLTEKIRIGEELTF